MIVKGKSTTLNVLVSLSKMKFFEPEKKKGYHGKEEVLKWSLTA